MGLQLPAISIWSINVPFDRQQILPFILLFLLSDINAELFHLVCVEDHTRKSCDFSFYLSLIECISI